MTAATLTRTALIAVAGVLAAFRVETRVGTPQ
jgi:hypothetical protein